jgi:hypothetical protein
MTSVITRYDSPIADLIDRTEILATRHKIEIIKDYFLQITGGNHGKKIQVQGM